MYWSKYFIPTLKEVPVGTEAISHQLSLRAGLVHMLTSGVYSYLPFGLKVLRNIENIIREEMEEAGARELFLPCLQPIELWKQTKRDEVLSEVMIRFKDNKGKEMCLGPTHEEAITDLVKNFVQSYRQLPKVLYQIQTKFRDEIRTRFGIVRACEFIMKDAYSFDINEEGLDKNYKLMYEAYGRIFKRCGLNCFTPEADSGVMGGSLSHEFMALADSGEDTLWACVQCAYASAKNIAACPKCGLGIIEKKAIELGHIFKLGVKYSQPLCALFTDEKGNRLPILMGCYGIGVSRMIAAIIETSHDQNGIIWPKEVSPFDVLVLPLNITDAKSRELAFKLYAELSSSGVEVLLDERDERPGVKFKDADLIGVPLRVVIGEKNLKNNMIELQFRADKRLEVINVEAALSKIREAAQGTAI